MTVAAAASAAAPAEQSSAPIEHVEAPPSPLSETAPAAAKGEPEAAKAPLSTREALRAAAARVEAGESAKAAGDPAKDPAKGTDLVRGEGGKFVPKDAAAAKPADKAAPVAAVKVADAAPKPGEQPVAAAKPAVDPNAPKHTAPERFSPDAKAAWDTAPEPVKAEVARMHREMTQGIEKHRAKAERDDAIAEFHEMAAKSGTDVKTALTRYTQMEGLLRQNPLKGLEAVCENIGVSLKDVARIVLEQPAEQQQSQSEATIRDLKQTVARLEQQVGGVTQHFQRQAETSVQEQITKWADSRPHFEIIAPHIAAEMRDGATSLDDAEERVLQKYPQLAAIVKASDSPKTEEAKPAASAAAAPDLEAQTLRGQKSIKGAPGSGSEPAAQPRSSSIKEALKRAAAKAG